MLSMSYRYNNLKAWRDKTPDYQSGSKNPSWKGGTSRSTIRRIVKKLLVEAGIDLYLCQKCGKRGDKPLNRHHKDHNRSNNVLENIQVLCVVCHNSGWNGAEHVRQRDTKSGQWI